jgi:hypothetical protein
MEKQIADNFVGKTCKLVLQNYFTIWGCVDAISDGFIVFRTPMKTSLINLSDVRELIPQ